MMSVIERFLKYVQIDSQSDDLSTSCPSTETQRFYGEYMIEELKAIGVENAFQDKNGYVYGKIPANVGGVPRIGFIAHLDTAPDYSGKDVKPQVVKNYDGKDIILKNDVVLSTKVFPSLKKYIGEDLITADGTTLLGADDKAGVASIVSMAEYFNNNPEIKHGDICIGFTPDEEVGRGADLFDVEGFGADFAYTIDGGELGEIVYENFNAASASININAASASININGRSVHPGSAKNKMINASEVLMKFLSMLPQADKPEYTEKYEGFNHVTSMEGSCSKAKANVIIRDHDKEKFEQKKLIFKNIESTLNTIYGKGTVECEIKDSYFNMSEIVGIDENIHIVETAVEAMKSLDVEPLFDPIRGGTDGARLSFMGLPCPNIFTGGHNFHGPFEYIPVSSLEKTVEVQIKIVELYANK
ncbi:peptidase T [Mycoplasmatota bacterium WC44]